MDTPLNRREVRRSARSSIAQLWASIFFAPEAKIPKSLLVTSAERGEGATQIAAALALAGAQTNEELKILLVDFNLHHPNLHKVFGIDPGIGLAELLRGTASLDDVTHPVGLPNLLLIPAGKDLDQPLGLLRGEGLRKAQAQIQEHPEIDHVIFDAAAANLYPEAQTLSGLVDAVVLVTKAGVTRRESVAEAKKRIEQNQGRVLGLVLNQRKFSIPGFLYRRL